ncbi:Hypothetical protein NTJ_02303 [Nesidiocoris tenuis]|uniref:Uncharacterized protein n=1 Tax=Nesidiocoris tenuis TaxID=355587 RepID=A0ABN7AAZ8_9HEMI|nr:Hypothetical protein NTJ_02303 [Nesidiocoris tenuis]
MEQPEPEPRPRPLLPQVPEDWPFVRFSAARSARSGEDGRKRRARIGRRAGTPFRRLRVSRGPLFNPAVSSPRRSLSCRAENINFLSRPLPPGT